MLKRHLCQISSTQRFEVVVSYLRRVLKVGEMDSVFLYVNSSFAPALDEIVGNLHRVSVNILSQSEGPWYKKIVNICNSASRIPRTSSLSLIR
jgi:hypothetical protein